jgi:hypothetical protein
MAASKGWPAALTTSLVCQHEYMAWQQPHAGKYIHLCTQHTKNNHACSYPVYSTTVFLFKWVESLIIVSDDDVINSTQLAAGVLMSLRVSWKLVRQFFTWIRTLYLADLDTKHQVIISIMSMVGISCASSRASTAGRLASGGMHDVSHNTLTHIFSCQRAWS